MDITAGAGRFTVLTRLFELVSRLNEDQQIMLLRQLDRSALTNHLYKILVDLSEEQQVHMLDQLSQMLSEEVPEKNHHPG